MDLNLEQLDQLLTEKKWDEARTAFRVWLKQGLTDEQKGALYVFVANLYMRSSTNIDKEYLDVLNEALEELKAIDKEQSSHEHGNKLKEVRDILL